MNPILFHLIQTKDFPQEASQAKKVTLCGAKDLHRPCGNKIGSSGSIIELRNFTERVLQLEGS